METKYLVIAEKAKPAVKSWQTWLVDWQLFVKLRLTSMVVMSSLMAYLIAANDVRLSELWLLGIGGFFITAAANGLNEVLEREEDALMKRTRRRPMAAYRWSLTNGILLSGVMLIIGIICLGMLHPLVSFLGFLSLVLYVFIYTPLKHYSPVSSIVGAVPGALPMLIGAVAAQKEVTSLGMLLFALQFLWQFPHFLAIGYLGYEDYKRAGFHNVPERNGKVDRNIGLHAAMYTFFILPVLGLLYYSHAIDVWSWIGGTLLTIFYLYATLHFHRHFNKKTAVRMMLASYFYLPMILMILWLGKV